VGPVTVLVTAVVPVTTGLLVIAGRTVEVVLLANVIVVEVSEVVDVGADEVVVTVKVCVGGAFVGAALMDQSS